MRSRRRLLYAVLALSLIPLGWFAWSWLSYPSDRTPEGAYLRVMSAVNRGRPEAFFAYTETASQHACYTIRDLRKKSLELVRANYPKTEQAALLKRYEALANAADGSDVFALYARKNGWLERLRVDVSGVAHVEVSGERATVVTVKKTRYPFRRRDNGIWGLTLFTAALTAEAERAARDHALIEQAANDYRRAKATPSN